MDHGYDHSRFLLYKCAVLEPSSNAMPAAEIIAAAALAGYDAWLHGCGTSQQTLGGESSGYTHLRNFYHRKAANAAAKEVYAGLLAYHPLRLLDLADEACQQQ